MPDIGPVELLITALIPAIYIGIVAVAVLALGRRVFSSDPAMRALRQRLATGEIDQAEYERMKAVLRAR